VGTEGNVDTGQLTTLLSRPLGVSEVVNPEAATGGENAESLARARSNAPLTVLTLERVVSEDDYANFARAFAGIDKAHALWISAGPARGMFLTIAGIDGAPVPEESATFRNLRDALITYGDPLVALRITNYSHVRFRCRLSIKVQAEYEEKSVIDSVDAALRGHFSFAQRSLGQTVSADEVIAVAQAVSGVEGVHLARLNLLSTAASSVEPRLFAALPVASLTEQPLPAQMLTISDDLELEVLP
jgi:predicted phage baseplate assembly protein